MTWPIPPETLATYIGAAVALVLVPGPAQALVLVRSAEGGVRAGVVTAVGLDAATIAHTLAAALGLSAILAASATAFTAVKLAGAVYLVWLGVRMMRARSATGARTSGEASGLASSRRPAPMRLLGQGFLTGILNPKVALFFLAFLPQFVRPERGHVFAQFLLLGGILALLDLVWAVVLAVAVSRAGARLTRSGRFAAWRDRVAGGVLVALGIRLAMERR